MKLQLHRKRVSVVCFFLTAACLLASGFGDPAGFLEEEQSEEVLLEGGLVWHKLTGRYNGLPQVIHTVTVDLSHPHLNLKLLRGDRFVSEPNQFHRRSTISQLQKDNGVSLAINTAFFDINATQTPFGLSIDERMLLRTAASNRAVLVFTDDKELVVGNFTSLVMCSHNGAAPVVSSVNGNSITDNSLHLYLPPWDRSPGNNATFKRGLDSVEVFLETGRLNPADADSPFATMTAEVVEIRAGAPSRAIGEGECVLVGTGTMRDFLLWMKAGDEVGLRWRISGGGSGFPTHKIRSAFAGSSLLVVNGVAGSANTSHWNDRHPRSAVGVAEDRQRMVLVLIEGRMQGRAEGMSLHTVAQLLLHMEAYNGLEFDGGGSSALAGRVNGANLLLSTPSGGTERYVPAGLGVLMTEFSSYPFFHDVKASASDREAVVTWKTALPAASFLVPADSVEAVDSGADDPLYTAHSAQFLLDPAEHTRNRFRLLALDGDHVIESPVITVPRGVPGNAEFPPDWWVAHYFPGGVADPDSDDDADGFTVLEEYAWGTDPTRPSSVPQFTLALLSDGSGFLRFSPFVDQKTYSLMAMPLSASGFSITPTQPEREGLLHGRFPVKIETFGKLLRVEVSIGP